MMKNLLQRLAEEKIDAVSAIAELVDTIRPHHARAGGEATENLERLTSLIESEPTLRLALRRALIELFSHYRQIRLYTEAGILPNAGFFGEMRRRVSHSILPDVVDPQDLKGVIAHIFPRKTDCLWVEAIPVAVWSRFLVAMHWEELTRAGDKTPYVIGQIVESLRILSYWIAAISFEPELLRIDPSIERFESPFVALNREMDQYLADFTEWWRDRDHAMDDEKHLMVLIDQCQQVVERIRRRALQDGTSLKLTYSLLRLDQLLARTENLLLIFGGLHRRKFGHADDTYPNVITLFNGLLTAICHDNDIVYHWRQNIEILAKRVTENAGHTGEHYITETRAQYWTLARSALGAGILIALMATFKLLLTKTGMAPLNEALAFSLNYGLGFMLIHIVHCTVATKQPAMTANAIAASIGEASGKASGKARDLANLTTLIARTTRSQIIAIIGNVMLAVPCAMVYSLLWQELTGSPLLSPESATEIMREHHPLYSGSLFFAAIAGFCLFLSGLIAGYYDNRASYNRIPERLLQLGWPKQFFGEERMRRFARYIGENLGALAGNFFFGLLLGGAWAIGLLFNLPIDIRHVAFSSAYLGAALIAFDFHPAWGMFAWAAFGVALIGVINLAVSFALALFVALRARQVTFAQRRSLAVSLWKRFWSRPREFFLPPAGGVEKSDETLPVGEKNKNGK